MQISYRQAELIKSYVEKNLQIFEYSQFLGIKMPIFLKAGIPKEAIPFFLGYKAPEFLSL